MEEEDSVLPQRGADGTLCGTASTVNKELIPLVTGEAFLDLLLIFGRFGLFAQVLDCAGKKAVRPARGVEIVSPSCGFTCSTMNWVTARGVQTRPRCRLIEGL
jgi:hypothetical protein